ncbi:16660_t:CDS:2 [Cetraspora pellucida]|uniref:16660_t:CDS:1 n=1 Tax=Cetraspora pellucida TaxID=1433469 RepID=A0A9N8VWT3_9GLOM|nr:16660_t:CDS:2 [Cetraspora pellucida]
MKDSIFILEADRPTGIATVSALFNTGSKHSNRHIHVTAGVSPNSSQEVRTKLSQCGAEVVVIDDPKNVKFKNVHKLMIILTPERLDAGLIYVEAANRDMVPFVLLQSVVMADERNDYVGKKYGELEEKVKELITKECTNDEVKDSHVHRYWSILRAGVYDHYLLAFKDCIKKGVLDLPIGDGEFAPVSVEDVGKAAEHMLDKSENYYSKIYTITGCELLSGKLLAERLSQTLHHELVYKPSEDEQHIKEHIKQYITTPVEVETVYRLFEFIKEGKLKYVTPHFTEIEGWKPKTVVQFFLENKVEILNN